MTLDAVGTTHRATRRAAPLATVTRVLALALVVASAVTLSTVPAGAATTATVTIQGFAFSPETTVIQVGDSVSWENIDFVAHNVSGGSFTSGNFSTGSFTHVFSAAGTFPYLCTLHSGMQATVIVSDAPDPVVPEVPVPALLGVTAVVAMGGALVLQRRGSVTAR
jgi:plastocyanin